MMYVLTGWGREVSLLLSDRQAFLPLGVRLWLHDKVLSDNTLPPTSEHVSTDLLTREVRCVIIIKLRGLYVSAKRQSTLDDFKLFYEELSFSLITTRIRRSRVFVPSK